MEWFIRWYSLCPDFSSEKSCGNLTLNPRYMDWADELDAFNLRDL